MTEQKSTTQPVKESEKKAEIKKYSPMQKLVGQAKIAFEKVESGLDFNREANFAVQILEGNSYLQKLDAQSIVNSVKNISLIGLTLNPALKYAYLVPRANKCTMDISYIGMIKLLTDAGTIKNVVADVVYQKEIDQDKFKFKKGTDAFIKHEPLVFEKDKGDLVGAYAIAYFRDGGSQFELMGKDEIEKIKLTSESYKNEKTRQYSPWENWESEMWKKTVLRRLFKMLPKTKMSDKLIAAVANEHTNEMDDLSKEDKYKDMFDEPMDAEIIE